jgi:hypothetical protein
MDLVNQSGGRSIVNTRFINRGIMQGENLFDGESWGFQVASSMQLL